MVRYAVLFWGIHDMICFKRTCLFTVHSGIEPSERQYAFYTYEYSYNAFGDMVWSYDPY